MPRRRKKRRNFTFNNNNGIKYEVLFHKPNSRHYGDADGTCSDPEGKHPTVHINPYLTKQSELNTSIHEFTHAFFWDATEQEVYKFANTLSRFLYNHCKWRKLERAKYKEGEVYKAGVLEPEKDSPIKAKRKRNGNAKSINRKTKRKRSAKRNRK